MIHTLYSCSYVVWPILMNLIIGGYRLGHLSNIDFQAFILDTSKGLL